MESCDTKTEVGKMARRVLHSSLFLRPGARYPRVVAGVLEIRAVFSSGRLHLFAASAGPQPAEAGG